MDETEDWQRLDRYLAGDPSPELRAWVEGDPARAAAARALREEYARRPGARFDDDALWARLSARIHRDDGVIPGAAAEPASRGIVVPGGPASRRPSELLPFPAAASPSRSGTEIPRRRRSASAPGTTWRIAAAVLVVAGAAAAWRVATRRADPAGAGGVAMREVVTAPGERRTVSLGDGSRVTLNAGSRLRYAEGVPSRDVHLEGEGYFEVTHDAARPFRVHAQGGVAEDLGTRFTVRTYPELAQVDVVVTEGRVSLRRDAGGERDSVVLDAGARGRLTRDGPPTLEANADTARWTGWTRGELALQGVTLEEALPQLERWYGVDLVADPRLAGRRVVATFHGEPLAEVLDALALALGVRHERTGNRITLAPARP